MPEVTGETEITFYLTEDTLHKLWELSEGEKIEINDGMIARKRAGEIEISATEEVTLEFELSDYAPDHEGGRD